MFTVPPTGMGPATGTGTSATLNQVGVNPGGKDGGGKLRGKWTSSESAMALMMAGLSPLFVMLMVPVRKPPSWLAVLLTAMLVGPPLAAAGVVWPVPRARIATMARASPRLAHAGFLRNNLSIAFTPSLTNITPTCRQAELALRSYLPFFRLP